MQAIKELRQKAGLSQAELAEITGVTQSTVSQWETGITLPATSKLLKLAEVLNCNISDLFNSQIAHGADA